MNRFHSLALSGLGFDWDWNLRCFLVANRMLEGVTLNTQTSFSGSSSSSSLGKSTGYCSSISEEWIKKLDGGDEYLDVEKGEGGGIDEER